MRNLEVHMMGDKMDEAVTHYMNSHQSNEPVHIDTNGIPMTVQNDGAGRVTIMHQQTYTTQMCRQVSVTEQVGEGPWGEELLEGPIAAIVAHLQNSRHPPPHHKVAQVRSDADTSVILDGPMRFNGQTLEQQSEPVVVQLPPMHTLPPLQDMKRCDTDWFSDKNKKQDEPLLQDSDSQVLEMGAGASPAQHKHSRKSLPHKKRISRKLKRNGNSTPQQEMVMLSCSGPVPAPEQEQILPDSYGAVAPHHTMSHEVRPMFICQICGDYYGEEQLKFYHHLKQHYEPHATIIIENPVPDLAMDKISNNCIVDNVATLPDSIVELSLENTVPKTMYQPIDKHILYTSSDKTLTYNSNKVQYSIASTDREPPPVEPEKTDLYETLDKLELYNCGKCSRTFRKQKQCEAHMREAHSGNTKLEDMGEFSEPEDLMAGIQVCVDGETYEQTLLPHLTVDNGHVHQEHTRQWYPRGSGCSGGGAGYCGVCAREPEAPLKLLKEEVLQRIFDGEVSDNANFADNMIPDHEPDHEQTHEHNDHGHERSDHGHSSHDHGEHSHGHNEHGHEHNEHSQGHNEHSHEHTEHSHRHTEHSHEYNEHLHTHDEDSHGHSEHAHRHNEHIHRHNEHIHRHSEHTHRHNEHGHEHNQHSFAHIDREEHSEHSLGRNEHDHVHNDNDHGHNDNDHGHNDNDHGHNDNEHGHNEHSQEHVYEVPIEHGVTRKDDGEPMPVGKTKIYVCPECSRVFTHRNSLLYHTLSHGGKQHTCRDCGKGFYTLSALKIHRRMHNGDRPYKCELCEREFRQWSDLKYHKISIHSDKKHFKCEFCGKEFARKYSLNLHVRIHTGEKNYKCDYCSKTFRCSSYKLQHMRIHTGDRPYKCDRCDKSFRSAFDLRRHTVTHDKVRNRFDEHKTKKTTQKKTKMIDTKEEKDIKEVKPEPPPKKIKQIAVASTTKQPSLLKKALKTKKMPKKGAPNVTIQNKEFTIQNKEFKPNEDFSTHVEVYDNREYAKFKNVYGENASEIKIQNVYSANESDSKNQIVIDETQQRDLAVLRPIYRGTDNVEVEKVVYKLENTDGKMHVFTHVEKSKDYTGSIVSNTQVLGDIRHLERDVAKEVRSEITGEGIETGFLERLTAMYNIPAV